MQCGSECNGEGVDNRTTGLRLPRLAQHTISASAPWAFSGGPACHCSAPQKDADLRLSLSGTRMAKVSGLRRIMKDVALTMAGSHDGQWIDLTIGNPAPIPEVSKMWQAVMADALAKDFDVASCRYGQSRGHDSLLSPIARYFNNKYDWHLTNDNIVVAAGCQMLSFAAATLFTGPLANGMRRIVLPIEPDYTGYNNLSLHDDCITGISPRLRTRGDRHFDYELDIKALEGERAIGMLMLSNPANPTGRSLTREELECIVRLAESRGFPVLIDHAYGLPFPQVTTPQTSPIWHPNVINCFSVSKAGIPGERIGFAVGRPAYIDAIASFVSNSILHAPQLAQMALKRALDGGELDRLSKMIINPYYLKKQQFAENLLLKTLPQSLPWRIHSGRGGMFCWLWIDHPQFDDEEFYDRLRQRKAFIMPGRHFFVNRLHVGEHCKRCLRISLSADEKILSAGIARIAKTLEEIATWAPQRKDRPMNDNMTPRIFNWEDLPNEKVTDTIARRLVTGNRMMLAHLYLKKGAFVRRHSHDNEQFTYILKGALRFCLGEDGNHELIVREGEVLHIPSNLPHSVEALENTLDLDVFAPIRQDWLNGTDSYFREHGD